MQWVGSFSTVRLDPSDEEGIGLVEVLGRVRMQVFLREYCAMIAAPLQCDVDGIPKEPHYVMLIPYC